MNEFTVELFIGSGNEKIRRLSSLNEVEMNKWKKDLEVRALSKYYIKKIKILD